MIIVNFKLETGVHIIQNVELDPPIPYGSASYVNTFIGFILGYVFLKFS